MGKTCAESPSFHFETCQPESGSDPELYELGMEDSIGKMMFLV